MNYPETLNNLIECFKRLPGIGEKTAERLALSLINADDAFLDLFSDSLKNIKSKIKRCNKCYGFSETEVCPICNDEKRSKTTICVVETPKDVISIERLGTYHGKYHVLDGLISPLDGKNPEDLNINSLLDRIEKEKIKEIILVLTPSIEGETTALYITKKINNKDVVVSKIAHGVPLGANMDYIDSLTLEMALENRTIISNS